MKKYGYLDETGALNTKKVQDVIERYRGHDGEIKERIVTVEMQEVELLKHGWKPIDDIDESQLGCEDGYYVKAIPYDAGDHISFKYDKKPDVQAIKNKIRALKQSLTDDDYKIIKCYELSLSGKPLPYDIAALHDKRQAVRDQINELEAKQLKLNSL